MRRFLAVGVIWLVGGLASPADESVNPQTQWQHWRGPAATGVSSTATPPLTWGESENVKWKVPIDGKGTSTPIVWGNQVFLVTAIDTGEVDSSRADPADQPKRPFGILFPNTKHQFVVISLDRATGEEVWRKVAAVKVPHQGHHGDNSFASASPTTDGERLYAWFGSVGLFCYDLAGELLWKQNFPEVDTRLSFGEGCSPVVYQDRVIVNRDNESASRITVLNAATGAKLWEKQRDEPSAWATPLVVDVEGKPQVITSASNRVRSYDLNTGELIWECGGQVGNVTPCPVRFDDLVICMSGYRGSAAMGLPLNARGDITDSDKIRWSAGRGTPYVPSPLLYDNALYFNRSNDAILTCLDAATGEVIFREKRLGKLRRVYASPVGAAGRVYFAGRQGSTVVLEHGPEFKVLAENRLDEGFDASPALAGGDLFLRGSEHLYCLATAP